MGINKEALASSGQTDKPERNRTQEVNPVLNSDYNTEKQPPIPVQKSLFGTDKYLADTRRKLAELYFEDPSIAKNEKKAIIRFWQTYEGLQHVLGDIFDSFTNWFSSATSPETITRNLRGLKEDGTIRLSSEEVKKRKESEQRYRTYWGIERGLSQNNDNGAGLE